MQKLWQNNRGSAIIIIVFITLMGFFGVSLLASDIIKSNLIMSRTQLNSTKAYFAAEVGLEQALWQVMKGDYELPNESQKKVFDYTENQDIKNFLDNGIYNVDYNRNNSVRTFVSTGGYASQHRSTEVSFCIPDCTDKNCGEDDGCGQNCPSSCVTDVGCRLTAPADSVEVEGSEGDCCGSEKCFQCAEGYVWNGAECVYDCVQQCEALACGELDPNCNKPCPGSCDTNPGCIATTAPQPGGTNVSTGSCCSIAGTDYTCYECAAGYGWNGSECVACVANVGKPYPGSNVCYDAGIYDCFGNQVAALTQPEKGVSCGGGNAPQVDLGMNATAGNVVYDASGYKNNGVFQGNNWGYRKKIIIDHTKFSKSINDFHFLLYIPKDTGLFYRAQDDGDDIMFKDALGNKIPHEIEYFQSTVVDNDTMGRLVAWLRIPQLSSSEDTEIYMYYGNSLVGSQQDPKTVWAEYKGVWHLDDSLDSSPSSANIGWGGTGAWSSIVPSMIYGGTNSIVSVYNYYGRGSVYFNSGSYSLDDTTISAWVKPNNSYYSDSCLLSFNYNWHWPTTTGQGIFFSGNRPYFSGSTNLSSGKNLGDGNWHHIAYVVKDAPGLCYFYVDGEIASSGSNCRGVNPYDTGGYSSISGVVLGMPFYGTGPWKDEGQTSFKGTTDELRFAYHPFDANYIKLSYQNQLDPAPYVKSIGSEENVFLSANWVPGVYGNALDFNGSSNYVSFATGSTIPLAANLTLEAWIYPTISKNQGIAAKWANTWGWYLDSLNRVCVYIPRTNTSTTPVACSAKYITLNTWSHVAFTYNESTRQVIFYTNGVAEAPVSLSNVNTSLTDGSLTIGGPSGFYSYSNSYAVAVSNFSGKIDEFKAYDYIRTAAQIQYDANRSVCDGEGACEALSAIENNTGSFQSCNDVCAAEGKFCSAVGTDIRASNGLMSIYNGGSCGTVYANCDTVVERNPNEATPFLCSGYQTNWTNCNCTVCDVDFGTPCENNPCIASGTGLTACDGTCEGAIYTTAGTPCGEYMECDGLGTCRNVCHPLIGKPCGEDQCNNPGVVDCDGFCVGSTPKTDGITCTNEANDPLQDQCWGGVCTECVAELGQACNDGECQVPGQTVCDGGCSACTDGDCATNPRYAALDAWCDSGYGDNTGMCDAYGVCEACDNDYLSLGANCAGIPCYNTGIRDCKTGLCPAAEKLPVDTYCTTLGGDPGACDANGNCLTCASGYMNPCNNDQPCKRAGTIKCDGVTCTTSGYLDDGDSCNAGFDDSDYYPNTGYCDASHNCIACHTGYLYDQQCNDGVCQNPGNYFCDGGCDACVDNDCATNPNNKPDETTCDAGVLTAQPYSGTCQDGVCDVCDSRYLNQEKCNTGVCRKEGDYLCDGSCSTGEEYADNGTICTGSLLDPAPGRETGRCDENGVCHNCDWYYVYDQPCTPAGGDSECYFAGKVNSCFGECEAVAKAAGTLCKVDGLANPLALAYTGKCDGAGNCSKCKDLYLNQTACNNQACHVPSTYSCEGECQSESIYVNGTNCDAGPAYSGSSYYPNTGKCNTEGNCIACNNLYLYKTPCYPTGVTDANKPCYNPGTVTSCFGTCPVSYKGAGIPCDANGNECNGSGVCTTPLEIVIVNNFQTDRSCQTVCASSPYVGRGCVDMGYDKYYTGNGTNNYYYSWYLGYSQIGTCSTVMSSYDNKKYGTYCSCGNCVADYGKECIAADQCNYQSIYQCNGTCPTNYKPNNTSCDPAGDSIYGYCYTGSCLECVQVPGSDCNDDECYNQGTYTCQGVCSTAANPYKVAGTACSGDGVCDGSGNCVTPSPLFNTACPIIEPKDEECYNPGTWNYDGTVCLNTSTKNKDGVCFVNSTGKEGRCSSAGDCIACSPLYNTDCPVKSPYNSFCYYAGKYTCNAASCTGAYYKNQGLGGCGTESYICNTGQCVVGVVGAIYLNIASGKSCDQVCNTYGYYCYGVGYDALASNSTMYSYEIDKDGDGYCSSSTINCSTVMTSTSHTCNSYLANWTRCNCTNCNALAWTSCASDSMWAGTTHDDECFNFGTYDCDGTCLGYGAKNEGGVCTTASGVEGRCSAGDCDQCADSYLNNEACVANSCANFTRECDGSCTSAIVLGVGESCGEGLECTENGECISASLLVDIVVPNFATGQSCNSICASYTDRYCESVGTNGTQAGGNNGYVMYYGLSDNQPACISQTGSCTTIVSRNPGTVGALNYGYTCSGNLTNWTYCRCTNAY